MVFGQEGRRAHHFGNPQKDEREERNPKLVRTDAKDKPLGFAGAGQNAGKSQAPERCDEGLSEKPKRDLPDPRRSL